MKNSDRRSFILSLVIGDGNLHNEKFAKSGRLTISHGLEQSDYIHWKAQLLSKATNRDVRVRSAQQGRALQLAVSMKRFRVWHNFCYKDGKKNIGPLLRFIDN